MALMMMDDLRQFSETFLNGFLDLLFPPRCLGCGLARTWLCKECQNKLNFIKEPFCKRCGGSLAGKECPNCRRHPLKAIDEIRSLAMHDELVRKMVHKIKYEHQHIYSEPAGLLLADHFAAEISQTECIIPVPLHPRRERERGYNQAAKLAQVIGRRSQLPVMPKHLCRTRYTRPQMELGAAERQTNVQGAFSWRGERLPGTRVLLIDDVCTTGATMDTCAAILKNAGAAYVCGLTITRA
jgi:ComF family protein